MKNIFEALLVISISLLISGCLPRGETKTLDEIYQSAKANFLTSNKKSVPGEVASAVEALSIKLQAFGEGGQGFNYEQSSRELAEILGSITSHAGYTSRPALGEVATQYRTFATQGDSTAISAKAKLLTARAMSLITGELQTTKFGL